MLGCSHITNSDTYLYISKVQFPQYKSNKWLYTNKQNESPFLTFMASFLGRYLPGSSRPKIGFCKATLKMLILGSCSFCPALKCSLIRSWREKCFKYTYLWWEGRTSLKGGSRRCGHLWEGGCVHPWKEGAYIPGREGAYIPGKEGANIPGKEGAY